MENQNIDNQPNDGEKKFTQAEMDAVIGKRLAEERAKFPSKEEMEGYRAYKAAQQTDADKISSITTERDNAREDLKKANAEVSKLKHERFLLGKNVPVDDLDYYDFKISKAVTEGKTYEQAAEEFLASRKASVRVDMGGSMGGSRGAQTSSSIMNDIIRSGVRK